MAREHVPTQQLKHDPLMDQYVKTADWVKPRQKPILIAIGVIAAAAILFYVYQWVSNSNVEKAGNAFGEALKVDLAQVGDPLPVVQPGEYAFKTDDEKSRKAAEAFEKVARDYPSQYGDVANYYAAIRRLDIDGGTKGEEMLRALAEKNAVVSAQARIVLAQRYLTQNKNAEALAELEKLKAKPGNVAPSVIELHMGEAYEALGKKQEASDIYFKLASQSAEKVTAVSTKALSQLATLDPERVGKLPEPSKKGTIDTSKILSR